MPQKKRRGCPWMPGDGILCFAVSLLTHVRFKRALKGASYASHCLMHCKSWQYIFFCLDGPWVCLMLFWNIIQCLWNSGISIKLGQSGRENLPSQMQSVRAASGLAGHRFFNMMYCSCSMLRKQPEPWASWKLNRDETKNLVCSVSMVCLREAVPLRLGQKTGQSLQRVRAGVGAARCCFGMEFPLKNRGVLLF